MIDKEVLLRKIAQLGKTDTKKLCEELGTNEAEVIKACRQLEEEGLIDRYTKFYEGDGFEVEIKEKGRALFKKKLEEPSRQNK